MKNVSRDLLRHFPSDYINNCVPLAMEELGVYIPSKDDDFIQRCYPNGVSWREIIAILDNAYPESLYHEAKPFYITYDNEVVTDENGVTLISENDVNDEKGVTLISDLTTRVNDKEAIFAGYIGHMFIIFNEGGVFMVREPQAVEEKSQEFFLLGEYLLKLRNIGVKNVYIIYPKNGNRINRGDARIRQIDVQRIAGEVQSGLYKFVHHKNSSWLKVKQLTKPMAEVTVVNNVNEVNEVNEMAKRDAEREKRDVDNDWIARARSRENRYSNYRMSNHEKKFRQSADGRFLTLNPRPKRGGTRKKTKKKQRRSSGVSRKRRG